MKITIVNFIVLTFLSLPSSIYAGEKFGIKQFKLGARIENFKNGKCEKGQIIVHCRWDSQSLTETIYGEELVLPSASFIDGKLFSFMGFAFFLDNQFEGLSVAISEKYDIKYVEQLSGSIGDEESSWIMRTWTDSEGNEIKLHFHRNGEGIRKQTMISVDRHDSTNIFNREVDIRRQELKGDM